MVGEHHILPPELSHVLGYENGTHKRDLRTLGIADPRAVDISLYIDLRTGAECKADLAPVVGPRSRP